jgi:hypothetical protein
LNQDLEHPLAEIFHLYSKKPAETLNYMRNTRCKKNLTHDSSNHYCFYAVKKNPKVTHREKLNRISKLDEATANIGNISQTLIKINTWFTSIFFCQLHTTYSHDFLWKSWCFIFSWFLMKIRTFSCLFYHPFSWE